MHRFMPALTALFFTATAQAAIMQTIPSVFYVQPLDVRLGQSESDSMIQAFDESDCITLETDLDVDGGWLPAGTMVTSHLLHFDPVEAALLQGGLAFDDDVLGVISSSAGLDATDGQFGHPAVIYPAANTEPSRGLEVADGYVIQATNQARMRVNLTENSTSDQLRVFVDCS